MTSQNGFAVIASEDALDQFGSSAFAVSAGDGNAQTFRVLKTEFHFTEDWQLALHYGLHQVIIHSHCGTNDD